MATRTRSPGPPAAWPRRLLTIGVLLLILGIPYSTFLIRAVPAGLTGLGIGIPANWQLLLLSWKELLLLSLALLAVLVGWRERRWPFRLTVLDGLIALFCLFVLMIGWRSELTLRQVLFGLRIDLSVFGYYWVARVVLADRTQLLVWLRWLAWTLLPIWLFGLAQTLVLPRDFLTHFGYSWSAALTGNAPQPYQLVGDQLVRAMATFPSPNFLAQYGLVVLPFFVLLGPSLIRARWTRWLIIGAALSATVLTFSRAGWVGLVVPPLLVAGVWRFTAAQPRFRAFGGELLWLGWLGLTAAATGLTVWLGQLTGQTAGWFNSLLLHGVSTAQHSQGVVQVWQAIRLHPWGTGIGTAGPATATTVPLVVDPESITLQLALEYGWLGLIMFIGLIGGLYHGISAYRRHEPVLTLALLTSLTAILTVGIFLPSWFSWASITWWLLLGLFVSLAESRSPRPSSVS